MAEQIDLRAERPDRKDLLHLERVRQTIAKDNTWKRAHAHDEPLLPPCIPKRMARRVREPVTVRRGLRSSMI